MVRIVLKQISRLILCFNCVGTGVGAVLLSAAILFIKLIELLHGYEVFAKAFFLRRRARAAKVEERQIDFFKLVLLLFDVEELADAITGHTVLSPLLIVWRSLDRRL